MSDMWHLFIIMPRDLLKGPVKAGSLGPMFSDDFET